MIKAAIFDMDGLLIDSEPLWQEAEILEFGKVGVCLSADLCLQTVGLRINEIVDYWYARYPWAHFKKGEMEHFITRRVVESIRSRGRLKEGVRHAIAFMKSRRLTLAIASSSLYEVIEAVLERFGLRHEFDVVHSAEEEERGKPDPAVYLTAARKLGLLPEECIAIEDSFNGVRSAKAAGMKCIVVPDSSMGLDERLIVADMRLGSLLELNEAMWQRMINS